MNGFLHQKRLLEKVMKFRRTLIIIVDKEYDIIAGKSERVKKF